MFSLLIQGIWFR